MTTSDGTKFPSVSAHSGKVILGAIETLTPLAPEDARKIAAELLDAARDAESHYEDLVRCGDIFNFHMASGTLHFVDETGQLRFLDENGATAAASLNGVTRLSMLTSNPTLVRRGKGAPITK